MTFSITGKPSWASFSSATGALSGTPSSANVGSYIDIGIVASDGVNTSAVLWFGITVQSSGSTSSTVKISGTPSTSATVGSAYKFQPTATDSAGHTLSFSVSNKPSWATFSIASGLLSGTPTSAQTGNLLEHRHQCERRDILERAAGLCDQGGHRDDFDRFRHGAVGRSDAEHQWHHAHESRGRAPLLRHVHLGPDA